jgi:hypothetical protein
MAVGYNPRMVTNGLVLCIDAANRRSYPGSGTTWTDLSGNGNNGTLVNSPTFSSDSFAFNGTTQYVQIAASSSLQISTGVTINSVVKLTGFTQNRTRLIDTARTTSPFETGGSLFLKIGDITPFQDISFFIQGNDNVAREVRKTNAGFVTSTTVPYIITARWRQSDGASSIFVNGVEATYISSVTFTGTVSTLTNPMMIGFIQGYNIYGNQTVYATQIYNRYLTDAEIRQNFNALRGRFGI